MVLPITSAYFCLSQMFVSSLEYDWIFLCRLSSDFLYVFPDTIIRAPLLETMFLYELSRSVIKASHWLVCCFRKIYFFHPLNSTASSLTKFFPTILLFEFRFFLWDWHYCNMPFCQLQACNSSRVREWYDISKAYRISVSFIFFPLTSISSVNIRCLPPWWNLQASPYFITLISGM